MKKYSNGNLTLPGSVLAIGAFDGVHRGHQAVIHQMVESSLMRNVPSVVFTFDPPPRFHFQGAAVLTTVEQKKVRLAKLGIDHVVFAPFDEDYANRSAKDFIDDLGKLHPMEIFVGHNFRFGRNREGDIGLLSKHFKVRGAQTVCCSEGNPISSTRIRQLLSVGDIQRSHSLLGWPPGL